MQKVVFLLLVLTFLTGCTNPKTIPTSNKNEEESTNIVPPPTGEDIIRTFYNLINEKRIDEAIGMMSNYLINDEVKKQAWKKQFLTIQSIKVTEIEPHNTEEWTDLRKLYKLTLDATISEEGANAPIPYYGWNNGINIFWASLDKENGVWKFGGTSTGP